MNSVPTKPRLPQPVDPAIRKTYDDLSLKLAHLMAIPAELLKSPLGNFNAGRDDQVKDLQGRLSAMENQFAGLKPPSAAKPEFFSDSNPLMNSFRTKPPSPQPVDPALRKTYDDLSRELAGVMALPGELNMPMFGKVKTDRDDQVKDLQGRLSAMENQFAGLKPPSAAKPEFFSDSNPLMNSFRTKPPSPQPVDPAIRKTYDDLALKLAHLMAIPAELLKSPLGNFNAGRDDQVKDLQGRLSALENQFSGLRSI